MERERSDSDKHKRVNGGKEVVSANELRARLYDTFKNSGVENALKVCVLTTTTVCDGCSVCVMWLYVQLCAH